MSVKGRGIGRGSWNEIRIFNVTPIKSLIMIVRMNDEEWVSRG